MGTSFKLFEPLRSGTVSFSFAVGLYNGSGLPGPLGLPVKLKCWNARKDCVLVRLKGVQTESQAVVSVRIPYST